MESITPVQQWRVTDENPASSGDELDYERCAALHNHIVELGWVGAGRDVAELNRDSWWDAHGGDAERIRDKLAPSLVKFLERTYIGHTEESWNWHYYLSGLNDPETFFDHINDVNDEYQESQFVWLYYYGRAMGHTNGLIFDQVEMNAIIQPTIEDSFKTMNGRLRWEPLEYILEGYIDMIECGKVRAVPNIQVYSEAAVQKPWVVFPYSDCILQRTVDAYHTLCSAIQSNLHQINQDEESRLLGSIDAANAGQITGFAREFLLKARKPPFKFIAPGIAIQNAHELRDQPYKAVVLEDDNEIRPLLLFRGTQEVQELGGTFSDPYNGVGRYPSGLYLCSLRPGEENPFADAVKFVLPYGIGAEGHAKSSDGCLIGDNRESEEPRAEDVHDMLYSTGYNSYIEGHGLQLHLLLENWANMVIDGNWTVDENGVAGGIERFREADTAEHCDLYRVLPDW